MKEKASKTKKSKIPVPENREALAKVKEVKKEMEAYYKKNKLDPTKDYTKDKKHGAIISKWIQILEVNRKKVKDSTPQEIHHKKSEDKNRKPKAEKAVKVAKDGRKVAKYDYPLVDGREMTSEEKKKYRIKMRKESKGGTSKPKKETTKKETKKVEPEKATKEKKDKKVKGKDKKKKAND
nr:MAG: hypothetical protein [Bacteriophage sp.]